MEYKNFSQAISYLSESLTKILAFIPSEYKPNVQEIRLRLGSPLCLYIGDRHYFVSENSEVFSNINDDSYTITKEDMQGCIRTLCGYSVHTHQNEIRNGYISVPGGHRAGICGTAVCEDKKIITIRDITSINLRIAREVKGVADKLIQLVEREGLQGILIVGSPGSGKTTVLRDFARGLSEQYIKISIIDERGEIQTRYGDVLCGYPKEEGIIMALRTLSPQIILCDEIGKETDAVIMGFNAGVHIVTTIHAGNIDELLRRPQAVKLLKTGAFSKIVLLKDAASPGVIKEIIDIGDLHDETYRMCFNNHMQYRSRFSNVNAVKQEGEGA